MPELLNQNAKIVMLRMDTMNFNYINIIKVWFKGNHLKYLEISTQE